MQPRQSRDARPARAHYRHAELGEEAAGFTADMSDDCSTEALALVQLRKEMTLPAAATAHSLS